MTMMMVGGGGVALFVGQERLRDKDEKLIGDFLC